jgi:hypothetical protein
MRFIKFIAASLLLSACGWSQSSGCPAGFSAPAVNGGNFVLQTPAASPVLLAFLALAPTSSQDSSRAVAVVLQSLDHQYGSCGLRVAALDASMVVSRQISRHEDIVNTAANWNLRFPVLEDPDGRRTQCFHIRTLPTILLISPDGKELGRWEGYTRTPVLARAIEQLVGGPLAAFPADSLSTQNSSANQK